MAGPGLELTSHIWIRFGLPERKKPAPGRSQERVPGGVREPVAIGCRAGPERIKYTPPLLLPYVLLLGRSASAHEASENERHRKTDSPRQNSHPASQTGVRLCW